MADLPQQKFHHVADNGEERSFISKVTVTQDGLFHITIPADLVNCVEVNLPNGCHIDQWRRTANRPSMLPKNLMHRTTTITNRVSGTSFDDCKKAIKNGLRDWLKCETTEETVIRYGYKYAATYWKMPDGTIYANGGDCENDPQYDQDQPEHAPEVNGKWFGNLHATKHSTGYMVSLYAAIAKKTTHTRGDVTEVEYSHPDFENFSHTTYGERLNCFVGLCEEGGWGQSDVDCEEMPYTEEAAKFFYEMLIGMCAFADKIEGFFAEPENVIKAIESGATLLIEGDI